MGLSGTVSGKPDGNTGAGGRPAGGAFGSIRDRLLAFRDRTLSNPAFQRWAASVPILRGVARRRARDLFNLCTGFVQTQVLTACVRLKVLEILAEGPTGLTQLADRTGLAPERARRLLDAAVGIGLLEHRSGRRYGLGEQGAALLGNEGALAMIRHHPMLYDDLKDPVALLRGEGGPTRLQQYWAYAGQGAPEGVEAEDVAAYSTLMSTSQDFVAADVLAAYPFHRHRRLMDVGGGEGTFLRHVGVAHPGLELVLFDLPAVAARAAKAFEEAGLSARAQAVGGDAINGALPAGADLISLVRVVHDHDDEAVRAILKAAHAALPPGGVLLIAEPMAEVAGAETVGTYFEFYLMAMGSGRPRTHGELREMLESAGFERVRLHSTRQPLLTSLVSARRGAVKKTP